MPSTYHRQHAAAGLLPTRAQTNNRTPSLRSGDICRGCIVWLPPKTSHDDAVLCNRDGCCDRSALQEGGYDHPVVVLKIRQRENSTLYGDILCTVVCVTTFQGTPLPLYLDQRLRRPHYRTSIPILPPDTKSLSIHGPEFEKKLFLEKDELKKQSYVKVGHTYEVPASTLTQYSRGRCRAYKKRLTKASYIFLMEELGLVPEVFEETASLFETAENRLHELATTVRLIPNASQTRSTANHSQQFVIPPVYQHSPIYSSQSAPQNTSYGGTETALFLPLSHQRTLPYSSTSEPGDEESLSFVIKCTLAVVVVVLGTFVWWRYSLQRRRVMLPQY
ncbi:hypothetical protein NA56DRAFT_743451 [Hyaloscypha hepaticicola]|uniref:Uncharacterized protein n=1 Tax=Hyaloscypha hepaticicola TaxID=2082293 RepID=A0A2J6QLH4_9HELO|nr:hypothetical protein NA56DRAFT_743451 [Hyaloscypha hepaticicola]